MSPVRIQRRRTKGWRMPEGAVYVGRPTVWGNPWSMADAVALLVPVDLRPRWLVDRFRQDVAFDPFLSIDLLAIRGKDLCCWCALDQPCHADVLLEIANAPTAAERRDA